MVRLRILQDFELQQQAHSPQLVGAQ